MKRILGLSGCYHDAAAALLVEGRIVALAQEGRFTGPGRDAGFPVHAARWCLESAGVRLRDVDTVAFCGKPVPTLRGLLKSYAASAPHGLRSFVVTMPMWLRDRLLLEGELHRQLEQLGGRWGRVPPFRVVDHHRSLAAAAFYPSPFESAAVLCFGGNGEWARTTAWRGSGGTLQPFWERRHADTFQLPRDASHRQVADETVLQRARTLLAETGERRLCLAGGIALDAASIERLPGDGAFDEVWTQPESGDALGALGAALAAWYDSPDARRDVTLPGAMSDARFGRSCTDEAVAAVVAAGRPTPLEDGPRGRLHSRHPDRRHRADSSPDTSERQRLRYFALGLAALVVILCYWLGPRLLHRPPPLWPLLTAWVIVMMAWIWPPSVRLLYNVVVPGARGLAGLATRLLLAAIFLGVLLPVGWAVRRKGR